MDSDGRSRLRLEHGTCPYHWGDFRCLLPRGHTGEHSMPSRHRYDIPAAEGKLVLPQLDPEKEAELQELAGDVRLKWEGPPLSRREVRRIETAVKTLLDRLEVPSGASPEAGITQQGLECGVVEVTVRIPVALLESDAEDPGERMADEILREAAWEAWGAAFRKALTRTFRKWRRAASRDDT